MKEKKEYLTSSLSPKKASITSYLITTDGKMRNDGRMTFFNSIIVLIRCIRLGQRSQTVVDLSLISVTTTAATVELAPTRLMSTSDWVSYELMSSLLPFLICGKQNTYTTSFGYLTVRFACFN